MNVGAIGAEIGGASGNHQAVDEAELQREVQDLLEARPQLLWHHCRRLGMCTGQPGWPDLIVVGRRVQTFELKGDETRHPGYQRAFGDALIAGGVPYRVWRPGDLVSGRIAADLDKLKF